MNAKQLNTALILLPDFLLIMLGCALSRYTHLQRPVWEALEKLVYWVLFPCMLLNTTSKAPIDWGQNTTMLLMLAGCMVLAALLGMCAKWLFHVDKINLSSGLQTTFRFNTYIAFAAAERLSGQEGMALMAITVACLVPLANVMAVFSLARHSSNRIWVELAKNPLIIATSTGLLLNIFKIPLPEIANFTLGRLGGASIPLGLMTVGAGLMWVSNKRDGALVAYWTTIKLLVLPALALFIGKSLELGPSQLENALLISSMPTATSAYILANRMGGNGAIVSITISLMTLLAAVTVPFWLLLL